jgi:hypothetical protein
MTQHVNPNRKSTKQKGVEDYKMNDYKTIMKVADLSQASIESINGFQSQIKTLDDKDVILIAYEK